MWEQLKCNTTYDGLLARKGQTCLVAPFTEDEQKYIDHCISMVGGPERLEAQQCYANAQLLLMFDFLKKFRYFEGYYQGDQVFLPVKHAWLMFGNKVVDFTPERNKEKHGPESCGSTIHSYFGMELPRDRVTQILMRKNKHYCMLDELQVEGVDLESL